MEFISNNTLKHSNKLSSLIEHAEEIWMASAFMKASGTNILLPAFKKALANDAVITIIAGQHFALTEPAALYQIKNLFGKQPACKLYIANATSKAEVFHPKLYLFKTAQKGIIICGSANITKGGIESNIECSVILECHTNDTVWSDALTFFKNLLLPLNAEEATLLAIKRYESFYESQKRNHEQVKPIPARDKNQLDFNYENLIRHFRSFDNKERDRLFEEKTYHYQEAKKVLNKIANDISLTKEKFIPLLEKLVSKKGEKGWWHSGSLFRKRRQVFPHYKSFQKLVQYIRQNASLSPAVLFDNAKKHVDKIDGAGVNYIAEIMMTYNPVKYANINKNPITVLRVVGDVHMKAHRNSFTGTDYEEYCDLVTEISEKLGLRNMLEADTFFNEIYWKIK